jgi:uncharacterized protein YprB with RNaseH-like and TPR domain
LSKPIGKDLETFVDRWYNLGHDGKLALAKEAGVTIDTAKHWVSDSGMTRKPEKRAEDRMTVTLPELLAMKPCVHLDFACFDIETSNLDADFSVLLTAAIKPYGQKAIVFRADDYPSWEKNRSNDRDITIAIANELKKHAILIAHYGQKFDIPFFRAKMVKHNLEPLPPMFGIDTWRIAKNNFKVTRRSLVNLANFFDIGDKSGVEGGLWMAAAYDGDKKAMDEIVKHNVIDVEVLERLACISFPYLKSVPRL